MVIRNCNVTGFWWGIYVPTAGDVLVEDNHLYRERWEDTTKNGTGYGLDVADSQDVRVRRNHISATATRGSISLARSSSPWTATC